MQSLLLPYDIESPWVPTPVAALLRYMTHHLSEQTDLLKPWPLIEMAFHSMLTCHVSPISGIDWNAYAGMSPDPGIT